MVQEGSLGSGMSFGVMKGAQGLLGDGVEVVVVVVVNVVV